MKSNFLGSLYLRLNLLLVCLMLSASPACAADYASLVSQAREQLQNERYIEALAAAKDAVRANPNDYKGHYYVAMAFMGMERFEDAETAVKRAQSLAPESARAGVEKLANTLKTRHAGISSLQAAEAAMAEGLTGKAARLYEQAWNEGRTNLELGLWAANIYANRLGQPVDAARVLRQVKRAAQGNPAGDLADKELGKMSGTLRQIAKDHYNASLGGVSCEKAFASLKQAEDADPSFGDIYEARAYCAAQGDFENFHSAIKDLAKNNLAKPEVLIKLPQMSKWMMNTGFTEFLTDLMGKAQVDRLNGMIGERRERYNKQLAQYKDDVAKYDMRVAQRTEILNQRNIDCDKCNARCKSKRGFFFGSDVAADKCYQYCGQNECDMFFNLKEVPKPIAPEEPR